MRIRERLAGNTGQQDQRAQIVRRPQPVAGEVGSDKDREEKKKEAEEKAKDKKDEAKDKAEDAVDDRDKVVDTPGTDRSQDRRQDRRRDAIQ